MPFILCSTKKIGKLSQNLPFMLSDLSIHILFLPDLRKDIRILDLRVLSK